VPTEVGFYHCTRAPAVEVAVRLAEKVWASGQRLLVVGEAARLQALDTALWTMRDDSFLPHALAGGEHDAEQPILLADAPTPANGAKLLMLLEVGVPAEVEGYDRVLNLFEDGTDAHGRARADWKALGGRDSVTRTYWQQNDRGGWDKRA
jgi:DNA polymerase-3 subunit chi